MHLPSAIPDPSLVLGKALHRTAERLGLSQREVARITGASEATISRVVAGARGIEPSSKEGELALWLVRLVRSLDGILSGDDEAARAWMRAPNRALGGVPAERVQSIGGLVDVVVYLDGMRGKV